MEGVKDAKESISLYEFWVVNKITRSQIKVTKIKVPLKSVWPLSQPLRLRSSVTLDRLRVKYSTHWFRHVISMSTRWNNGVITPLGWPRKALNELEEMAGEKETGLLCLDCYPWLDGWI